MRVAVVGSRGQLGAALVREFSEARHEVVSFDRRSLDVTDARAVLTAVTRAKPDVVVNGTAFNAVDAAESQPLDALAVNAFAVRSLARAAGAARACLVHYSTDFVFDGLATVPYSEDNPPNPKSVYAVSKLLGEWFALEAPRGYVLRVESLFGGIPGGPPAKGTVASIVASLREGHIQKVLSDRTVSPTFVADAARSTRELLERQAPPGLYHCVNTGHCTWLEFALEAARLLGVEPKLEVMRTADMHLPAARPQYCALSNRKLTSIGIEMPSWQEALRTYVHSMRE